MSKPDRSNSPAKISTEAAPSRHIHNEEAMAGASHTTDATSADTNCLNSVGLRLCPCSVGNGRDASKSNNFRLEQEHAPHPQNQHSYAP